MFQNPHPSLFSPSVGLFLAGLTLWSAGCGQQPASPVREMAYVRGAGVPMRNRLGPSSVLVGTLESGAKVEVLEKRPRWAQVRTADGRTGWVQSRSLVSQPVVDQFQRLARESASLSSQGKAQARREASVYLEPRRESETFYRLAEREEVEVLSHRVAERGSSPGDRGAAIRGDPEAAVGVSADLEIKGYEDWLLVRASGDRVGWVLENFLDMNVPIEVAQYNEGLRIRAWFILRAQQAQTEESPWYLWATIHPQPGLPFDYDEIRVFVWNPKMSRYETSYRERNLIGFYPIQVEQRETAAGLVPAFHLQLEDEAGKRFRKSYTMAGRLVQPLR